MADIKSLEGGVAVIKKTSDVLKQVVSDEIVIRYDGQWRLTTLINQWVGGAEYHETEDIIIADEWTDFLALIEEHFG